MVREDVCRLEELPVIVTGTLGLGHTVPSFILVKPWRAEATLKTEVTAFLIRVGEGAAGQVAGIPALQVHLTLWAAQCWRQEMEEGIRYDIVLCSCDHCYNCMVVTIPSHSEQKYIFRCKKCTSKLWVHTFSLFTQRERESRLSLACKFSKSRTLKS